jgi:peroxiredoxin
VAELQGLGAELSDAERAGVEIVAISPDPNEQSQRLAEGLRLGYRFLADRDLAVARRYGLVHPRGGPAGEDVPRPATVVLDRDGVVRWFSISTNYQVRPDPADVRRAVRALSAPPQSAPPPGGRPIA